MHPTPKGKQSLEAPPLPKRARNASAASANREAEAKAKAKGNGTLLQMFKTQVATKINQTCSSCVALRTWMPPADHLACALCIDEGPYLSCQKLLFRRCGLDSVWEVGGAAGNDALPSSAAVVEQPLSAPEVAVNI
jgi:hypothetical protein